MGFDIKRAESISNGFKEWIHTGRISYDNAVKQIKETYREDMAREIIRILERDIKEVIEKCRWALVFEDVEETERARERLSWHNIYPDSQEENKLLWADKEEAEYAREHVGGLIEPWGKPTPVPEGVKEEIKRVLTTVEKRGTKIKHRTVGTVGVIVGTYHDGFTVYVPKEKETLGLAFGEVREWDVLEIP